MLYVVDFPAGAALQDGLRPGPADGVRPRRADEHVSFGSVLGEDKQAVRTRKGGAIELGSLRRRGRRQLGLAKYEESYESRKARRATMSPELTAEVKADIAEAVGVGAVKYADLSQNRISDYVFSYDKMLATEGNTATYMQYAYARCRAIFRKADADPARFRTSTRRPCTSRTRPSGRWRCTCSASPTPSRRPRPSTCRTSSPHTCGTWRRRQRVLRELPGAEGRRRRSYEGQPVAAGRPRRPGHPQALDLLGIRTVERM